MSGKFYRNYKAPARPSVSISRLAELESLFKSKNWLVENDKEYSLFRKFKDTLSKFTDTQQQFLISLTYSFLWIPGCDYNKHLLKLLENIRNSIGDKFVYFLPCKPFKDYAKVKGCDYVWYNLRDNTFRYEFDFGDFKMVNTVEEVDPEKIKKGEAVIVLVDDFVGTGETVLKTLVHVKEVHSYLLDYSSVKLMAIVAQRRGLDAILKTGVEVFFSELAPMGINDQNVSQEEKDRQYQIMKEIEDKMDVLDSFRNGFCQSEALVSMIRCPNNTFPVYWLIKKTSPYERI